MLNTLDKVFELLNDEDNTNEKMDIRINIQNIMDMVFEDKDNEIDIQ